MRKLPRLLLVAVFLVSALWESIITVVLFVSPETARAQYGAPMTPDVVFFSNIIGGFMILFSAFCWLTTYQLYRRDTHGLLLATLIGIFWAYMGVGLYRHLGAPPFVLMDTVRGTGILFLVGWSRRSSARESIVNGLK